MEQSLTELEEQNIDPRELQATLMGFLGQTYQEISRYDSNLVSPNAFLAPKKEASCALSLLGKLDTKLSN